MGLIKNFHTWSQLNGSNGEWTGDDDRDQELAHAERVRRMREARNARFQRPVNGGRNVWDPNVQRNDRVAEPVVRPAVNLDMPVRGIPPPFAALPLVEDSSEEDDDVVTEDGPTDDDDSLSVHTALSDITDHVVPPDRVPPDIPGRPVQVEADPLEEADLLGGLAMLQDRFAWEAAHLVRERVDQINAAVRQFVPRDMVHRDGQWAQVPLEQAVQMPIFRADDPRARDVPREVLVPPRVAIDAPEVPPEPIPAQPPRGRARVPVAIPAPVPAAVAAPEPRAAAPVRQRERELRRVRMARLNRHPRNPEFPENNNPPVVRADQVMAMGNFQRMVVWATAAQQRAYQNWLHNRGIGLIVENADTIIADYINQYGAYNAHMITMWDDYQQYVDEILTEFGINAAPGEHIGRINLTADQYERHQLYLARERVESGRRRGEPVFVVFDNTGVEVCQIVDSRIMLFIDRLEVPIVEPGDGRVYPDRPFGAGVGDGGIVDMPYFRRFDDRLNYQAPIRMALMGGLAFCAAHLAGAYLAYGVTSSILHAVAPYVVHAGDLTAAGAVGGIATSYSTATTQLYTDAVIANVDALYHDGINDVRTYHEVHVHGQLGPGIVRGRNWLRERGFRWNPGVNDNYMLAWLEVNKYSKYRMLRVNGRLFDMLYRRYSGALPTAEFFGNMKSYALTHEDWQGTPANLVESTVLVCHQCIAINAFGESYGHQLNPPNHVPRFTLG